MNSQEQQGSVEQVWDAFARFAKRGSAREVNNFTLEGPVNTPTQFHTIISIGVDDSISLVSTVKEKKYNDALALYNRVLKIEISQRIKKLQIKGSDALANGFKALVALEGMPYIVLAFGTTRDTKEEVISLFSVKGITPESGLDIFKASIRSRKIKFN